jgi:methionine salvage enolase-phosphatase E1
MTLDVKPEIAAALEALAAAKGLSVEDYLEQLVENQLPVKLEDAPLSEGSGMVWENGLFVYRTGRPLPSLVVDDAIRQVREERAQHILGKHS